MMTAPVAGGGGVKFIGYTVQAQGARMRSTIFNVAAGIQAPDFDQCGSRNTCDAQKYMELPLVKEGERRELQARERIKQERTLDSGGIVDKKLASKLGVQPHARNFRKDFLQVAFAAFHNILLTRFLRQLQRHTVSGQRIAQHELVARLQNFKIDSVDCIGKPLAGRKNTGRSFIDPIPCIGGERCLVSTAPQLQQPAERLAHMLACWSISAKVVGMPSRAADASANAHFCAQMQSTATGCQHERGKHESTN